MNAREELEAILTINNVTLKCALIKCHSGYDVDGEFNLYVGHTDKVLELWLESLDFNYDSGYGGQELFGTLWFTDGTWAMRSEYDGSEWWEYQKLPDIPDELFLPFPVGTQK